MSAFRECRLRAGVSREAEPPWLGGKLKPERKADTMKVYLLKTSPFVETKAGRKPALEKSTPAAEPCQTLTHGPRRSIACACSRNFFAATLAGSSRRVSRNCSIASGNRFAFASATPRLKRASTKPGFSRTASASCSNASASRFCRASPSAKL